LNAEKAKSEALIAKLKAALDAKVNE
jgi:hypothetical protein